MAKLSFCTGEPAEVTTVRPGHLCSGDTAYLSVAVQAVHIELRGAGHHEVALTVVEEVAVHGKLEPGGRVRLLVHRVHVAATVTPEPPTQGTGTAADSVRRRAQTPPPSSEFLRLRFPPGPTF